jgi:hypothetical protein
VLFRSVTLFYARLSWDPNIGKQFWALKKTADIDLNV